MGASVRPDPMDAALAEIRAQQSKPDPMDAALAEIRAKTPASNPDRPGVLSRAVDAIGASVSHAVQHPIDTIESTVVAPIKSAFTAAVAPGVGESRPDARLSKGGNSSGRAIDTSPYDAEHGGVTRKERTAAGVQTLANIATPAAFGPLASKVGKTGALALSGAAEGAAYNPDDPAAGAVAGGVMAPAVGAAVRGGAKAVDATRQTAGLMKRIRNATPLDENAVQHTKNVEAADRLNYGAADAEADAAGGSSPALAAALDHPRIKPFVDMVRASDAGANATDAELATEAYKLISRQRRGLQKKLAVEYDAKADLDARDLANAAKRLKAATAAASEVPRAPTTREALGDFQTGAGQGAGRRVGTSELQPEAADAMAREAAETPQQRSTRAALEARSSRAPLDVVTPPPARTATVPAVMPSFPTAVSEHARMMGERNAFNTAADATKRIMRGTTIAANKLDTQSPAAFLDQILGMSPGEVQAALEGTLGRAREESAFKLPSAESTLFGTVAGVAKPLRNIRRIAPYIDALDKQAGKPGFTPMDLEDVLRSLGVVAAPNPDRQP